MDETIELDPQMVRSIKRQGRRLRARRYALVAGLITAMLVAGYAVWSITQIASLTQTNHGLVKQAVLTQAVLLKKNNEIIRILDEHTITLDEVKVLESEVGGVAAELPIFKADLTIGQNELITQYNTLVLKLDAICAQTRACSATTPTLPLQPVPPITSPATVPRPNPAPSPAPAPPTTTTTHPGRGRGKR
jgi:hypothetical protein